jgi:hypothetical protein
MRIQGMVREEDVPLEYFLVLQGLISPSISGDTFRFDLLHSAPVIACCLK